MSDVDLRGHYRQLTCSQCRQHGAAEFISVDPDSSEREDPRLLVTTRNIPADQTARAEWVSSYSVDPMGVAQALLDRISSLADERARSRRSLMNSIEMIEAADLDVAALRV